MCWPCIYIAGILDNILNVQPKEGGGAAKGETREAVVSKIADDMLRKLPRDYVPHEVKESLVRYVHLKIVPIANQFWWYILLLYYYKSNIDSRIWLEWN